MTVVAVKRARQSRVVLVTDSGEEFTVDKATWEESPFGVDSSLSHEEIEELLACSARRRAQRKAVYLLSRRDYSRKELEQRLCREGGRYAAEQREAAAQAAAQMEAWGYVNDKAYAERLAQRYVHGKLYPARRAVAALCEKGIGRALAEEAVAALGADDAEIALEFLRKKRYTVSNGPEQTGRVAAAMARYGFSGEDIRRALSLSDDTAEDSPLRQGDEESV